MENRERMPFNVGELGIVSTEEFNPLEIGENFLNSDTQIVKPIKKAAPETEEESEEEKKKKEKEAKEAKSGKEFKEIVISNGGLSEDEFFGDEDQDQSQDPDVNAEEVTTKKPVEKVETQENTEEQGEDENQEEPSNPYEIISKELLERGLIYQDEDDAGNPIPLSIQSPEQLLESFQKSANRKAADVLDKFLEKHGDDYKEMFNDVFVRGVSPQDYLSRYTKMESLHDLDLSDEGVQERLVRELYKSEGRSAEYIEKKIAQSKNYSDLADEATEAQRILIEKEGKGIEEAAAQKEQENQRKQQIKNQYSANVNKILQDKLKTKDFDGIPVDEATAKETFAYLTQEKYQTPDKQLLTTFDKDLLDLNRPENHELKVKTAIILQMLKKDPTLSKIINRGIAKENNELFKGLRKTAGTNSSKQPSKSKSSEEAISSWFSK